MEFVFFQLPASLMNFSMTSGEQSLQVFTATLILSPFCSIKKQKVIMILYMHRKHIYADSTLCTLSSLLAYCTWKYTYSFFVNSIIDFSKKSLAKNSSESDVISVDLVLHNCRTRLKFVSEFPQVSVCKIHSTVETFNRPDFGLSSGISQ